MRLIDADAFIAKLNHVPMVQEAIRKAMDTMPTIEERKGEWEQIEVSYFADMDDETKTGMAIASMFCPRCKRYHNEVYLYGNPTFGANFCPNCGADMRKQP